MGETDSPYMEHVYFEVLGDPVPKARARTVRKGGRTWSFTPKKVVLWEKLVKTEAEKHFKKPLIGPIMVSMVFYLNRPASRRVEIWVPTTPDLDNLEKAVLDALNGVAYEDDRYVVSKNGQKKYVRYDEPRVCVRITSLSRQIDLEEFGVKVPPNRTRRKATSDKTEGKLKKERPSKKTNLDVPVLNLE
jgi:Holliday junction resolvase RusA-like endonuclease